MGVAIKRGPLAATLLPNRDSTAGLLAQGVAAEGLGLGAAVELGGLSDAEALGIDKGYDEQNGVVLWHHVKEFFRMAPKGSLWLMLTDNAVEGGALRLGLPAHFQDAARLLLNRAGGEIRQLAVALNPAEGYSPVYIDGMDSNVLAAIPPAQALAGWAADNHMPCHVVLEGRDFGRPAGNPPPDLTRLPNGLKASKVSVCIAQDYGYAGTLAGHQKKHAAVGTLLGTVAASGVGQSIGEVGAFNLTDATRGEWLVPGVSGNWRTDQYLYDYGALKARGYVMGTVYAGLPGVRWNGGQVCAPFEETVDGLVSEHAIELGRTLDKAVRELRFTLLPFVQRAVPLESSGRLAPAVVDQFNAIGNRVFDRMRANGEISNGATRVDGDSDLNTAPRVLRVGFSVQPLGIIDRIEGTINLTKSI